MVGLFVAVSPDAVAAVSGGINYEITSDGEVRVIASTRPYKGDIVIPAEVTLAGKTYKVTAIGALAFRECSGLTSIEIPNSVVQIGDFAFEDCSSLTSVEIPNSIVEIEYGTFRGCSALASVVIPNSVFVINDEAFSHSGLTTVTIGENVQSIGQGAFLYCHSLWVVNSLNPTPPVIRENTFSTISYLYVPLGSKAAYEQDNYWRYFFYNIDEIEEFGDHIDGIIEADFELDGIYYNIANDGSAAGVTYKNRNYNSYSGDVVIPAKVTYNNVEYSVS